MAPAPLAQPLILVVGFSKAIEARLGALRRAHYPSHANRAPAHLTLVRQLPGPQAAGIDAALRAEAARTPAFEVLFGQPFARGGGVLLPARSSELHDLHARLVERLWPMTHPQDRGAFEPHVTLAGKLAPKEAEAALLRLAREAVPARAPAQALVLYAIGPAGGWTLLVRHALGR